MVLTLGHRDLLKIERVSINGIRKKIFVLTVSFYRITKFLYPYDLIVAVQK